MMKEVMLNRCLIPFRETGNPIYAWKAFFNARRFGLPIPEDVLKYLDGVAHEITEVANNPPKKAEKRNAELAKALGMQKDTTGQGSVFTNYSGTQKIKSDRQKREIAMDAFFEVRECGYNDGAFNFLADKYKQEGREISKATIDRIYKSYLPIWQAKADELKQSGQGFTVAGDTDDFREAEIILALIKDTLHELP